MRRSVLLGAGALIVVIGFVGLRSATRHQAGQVLDQGIDQVLARLPPGYAVRHGVVDYNPLTNAATVHAVVLTHDGATIGTADTVTVSGADGQALQDVFDPAAYPAGRPGWTERRLLIADASARNLRLVDQGSAGATRTDAAGAGSSLPVGLVIGHASLHRLSGRPFMLPPTPENRARSAFLADAALALAADSVQAGDIVVAAPAERPGAAAGGMSVKSASLSDYDSGKLGSLAIASVALDGDGKSNGPPFHLTVGSLDLKTADMRGALESIRRTGHGDRSLFGRVIYERTGMSDMTLDIASGPHLALHELRGTQSPGGAGPSTGLIRGLTIGAGQAAIPPAAAASLAAFGMNSLTMDADTASTMPGQSAQAPGTLREDIVLHDLAVLHLQVSYSGYDAARVSTAQPYAALMATTLEHASIVLEDHSLTERLLAVAAAQAHSTPALVRAQLAMPLVTLGLMLPGQPDAADQLSRFLNHPGTLTVTMNPPQKTTLSQVAAADLPTRAQMLGLHIAAQ